MNLVSEEFVMGLLEITEAVAAKQFGDNMGHDTTPDEIRISKLTQDFIDVFVFGESKP